MQGIENKKAKVMIVDDHAMVRQGLSMLINLEPDMVTCCQADNIQRAIEANRACGHDIAIVDMSLEDESGLELVRRLQSEFPDMAILMLSMHDESIYADAALKAGARGYVMKQEPPGTLLRAIRQVLRGDMYLSDQLRSEVLKKSVGETINVSPVGNLTPAELEVLHLVGSGMGTAEIARQLSRSIKTIETHKSKIKKKLNLENSTRLASYAVNLMSSGTI